MIKKLTILAALIVLGATSGFGGSGAVSVGEEETLILPASQNRRWIVLQNNSANDIYIKADGSSDTLTAANGIRVAANGGVFSITATGAANPAQNAIRALSASGVNSLTYQEGNEN